MAVTTSSVELIAVRQELLLRNVELQCKLELRKEKVSEGATRRKLSADEMSATQSVFGAHDVVVRRLVDSDETCHVLDAELARCVRSW